MEVRLWVMTSNHTPARIIEHAVSKVHQAQGRACCLEFPIKGRKYESLSDWEGALPDRAIASTFAGDHQVQLIQVLHALQYIDLSLYS